MDINSNLRVSKIPLKELNENLKSIISNAKKKILRINCLISYKNNIESKNQF